jgi:hypothetical protein
MTSTLASSSPRADQLAVSTGGTGRLLDDASADVTIGDKIIHAGDIDTAIRFPAADTVSVETDGSEGVRIKSDGELFLAANNTHHIHWRSAGGCHCCANRCC